MSTITCSVRRVPCYVIIATARTPRFCLLPGIQDITAHVDFTALAKAGVGCGLELAGFTTPAHYLLDTGIELPAAVTGFRGGDLRERLGGGHGRADQWVIFRPRAMHANNRTSSGCGSPAA